MVYERKMPRYTELTAETEGCGLKGPPGGWLQGYRWQSLKQNQD